MIGDAQGIVLPHRRLDPFDSRAVEQIVDGPVRAVQAGIVGVMGQPARAVDATGFVVGGNHRVLVPQQMQGAVGGVGGALFAGQALVLPQRQQVEVATDQPGRAAAFELIENLGHGRDLCLQRLVRLGRSLQMGIEDGELAAVAQWQVRHQQGVFRLELATDRVGRCDGQLQAFGVLDPIATQGRQLPADAPENVRVGHEVSLPVEGMGAARIQVGEPLLQQFELVLVIAGFGAVIEFLQQHDIRLLVADHSRHFVEAEGHVFRCWGIVVAGGQVIPEDIALARQVLDVPGHDLQCLAGCQPWRLSTARDRRYFPGFGAPGQAVRHYADYADDDQQSQQGVAQ